MEEYQISSVIILIMLTGITIFIANRLFSDSVNKLTVFLFICGFAAYSGIGICIDQVSDIYFVQFFLFLFVFIICFKFGRTLSLQRVPKQQKFGLQEGLLKFFSIVFWGLLLFRLVYPTNRLVSLFTFNYSLTDAYAKTSESGLVYLTRVLVIMLRPFFYCYLYKKRRPIFSIGFITLETLVNSAMEGYLSRSEMLSKLLFIVFIVVTQRQMISSSLISEKTKFSIYKKAFMVIVLVGALSLPLLYSYQYFRLGMSMSSGMSLIDKVWGVLGIEFTFPKLYDRCALYHEDGMLFKYILYLITLPFPKSLLGIDTSFILNYGFSTYISGISVGAMGYSVYLPGLLGEGIIICGQYFAFVFGGLLGFVIGFILNEYSKYEDTTIWVLYLVVNVFIMNRGGSQGVMSTIINGSVLWILLSFLDIYKLKIGGRQV